LRRRMAEDNGIRERRRRRLWLLLPSPAVEREKREEGGGATEVGGVIRVIRSERKNEEGSEVGVFAGWRREVIFQWWPEGERREGGKTAAGVVSFFRRPVRRWFGFCRKSSGSRRCAAPAFCGFPAVKVRREEGRRCSREEKGKGERGQAAAVRGAAASGEERGRGSEEAAAAV
ncbi:hypothetical protein HAX54_049306, partial [Datura stramonium]|nr:hypothetical protein [Datura stramonium]